MKFDTMKRQRRVIASLLTTFFLMQQSMIVPAMATDITGVTGNNGVYNIDPTGMIAGANGVGFRQYENFNLSAGDIANLIFQYGAGGRNPQNIETFVNLVQNKINIDGIVNSMRNNNFYNGKAVFVSPNGMVVGASGVLNVGSLSVLTPTQSDFDKVTSRIVTYPNYQNLYESKGNGTVKIDGKVFTRAGAEINAASVAVGNNGGIMNGVTNMAQMTSNQQANTLFNELVNTNNIASGTSLVNEGGRIVIKAYGGNNAGVEVAGNVRNFDNGGVVIDNTGVNGVKIASAGNVFSNGTVSVTNTGKGGVNVQGKVTGREVNFDNQNSDMKVGSSSVNDNITAYGDININLENGSLLNNGANTTQLVTNNGGNLTINVQGGSIGD